MSPVRWRPRSSGGVPARRAVIRWAWRMFRREWRQQTLVLALLTVAVAAAAGGISMAYNLPPSPDAGLGKASHRLDFDTFGSSARARDATISAARNWFGAIDVISRGAARVPGSVETVEVRAQDPRSAIGGPMLRLRKGRYPAGAGEVALTDDVARLFKVGVGDPISLDARRTVVGLVENPGNLDAEFALVQPSWQAPSGSLSILVNATDERVRSLPKELGGSYDARGRAGNARAAAGALGIATVGLLLVSLVAAAGFVVVAQRRLRQLGMLAAIGADEKHLRLVTLANGALVGTVAAALGTVTGLAGWVLLSPQVEPMAGHRIDRLDIPWAMVGWGMLLAVATAVAAAWWPARAIARIPITQALSARPPRPKPAHRSAVLAALLMATGAGCLYLADQKNPLLMIIGILATTLGVLFIGPMAMRALAAGAARLPVSGRLALRDLARHQARSGSALAAISLALGVPVALIVTASAAEPAADEGNLSSRQLVVRIAPEGPKQSANVMVGSGEAQVGLILDRTPAQLEKLRTRIAGFAATLPDAEVLALDVALDPAVGREAGADGREGGRPANALGKKRSETSFGDVAMYVATPELLRHYGLAPESVGQDVDVLTVRRDRLHFLSMSEKQEPELLTKVRRLDAPRHSAAPTSLITADGLRRRGWLTGRAGWFVEAGRPLTAKQLTDARDMAKGSGMTIEARRDQHSTMQAVRTGATTTGMLLALGVLAMTVGLIRGETSRDLRTLTAVGAGARTRRALAAATAGALALLGAFLGMTGAYLALIAGYSADLGSLGNVPYEHLSAIAVGLPLLAAVAGWLLAGREPPALARQPLD